MRNVAPRGQLGGTDRYLLPADVEPIAGEQLDSHMVKQRVSEAMAWARRAVVEYHAAARARSRPVSTASARRTLTGAQPSASPMASGLRGRRYRRSYADPHLRHRAGRAWLGRRGRRGRRRERGGGAGRRR
ncbi:hypothetical protein SBD_1788 [Streptomyces bottropensis ATCC 25435]|uniref:Uncharacterized protein n=1 Tax=Streptomyces bottropensis ATCC 25435 TaxID=1054862 RepID=M3FUT5_9ACTN|nr:hypothetical protein SBD_1788 [Streptomyces bottropensis ATCC 25435]